MDLTTQKCSCCDDTINVLTLEPEYLRLLDTQEQELVLIFSDEELKQLYFTLKEKVCQ